MAANKGYSALQTLTRFSPSCPSFRLPLDAQQPPLIPSHRELEAASNNPPTLRTPQLPPLLSPPHPNDRGRLSLWWSLAADWEGQPQERS